MNPDFRDLLSAFNAHGVEYLVVGAHALGVHGHVRATKDQQGRWARHPPPARAAGASGGPGRPSRQAGLSNDRTEIRSESTT